jgi:hypothetical protein
VILSECRLGICLSAGDMGTCRKHSWHFTVLSV